MKRFVPYGKINHCGDTRIIKKFALFPITIGHELRWLEWVKITQKRMRDCWDVEYRWYDEEFVN